MSERKIKIGITQGDINGISYEIILKVLSEPRMNEICTLIVYGNSKIAGYYKKTIPGMENFSFNIISAAEEASNKRANLINCIDESAKLDVGKSTSFAGQYAVASLHAAMKDLNSGVIDAVVTCPINKSNIRSEAFDFVGHTEYFSAECDNMEPLMFMVSETMKVGLVTIHEPLKEVSAQITTENILKKLRVMKQSLTKDFCINDPKIAVLGLNPHAGDSGLLGSEEQDEIIPAIVSAKDERILAFGPYAADGFFSNGNYKKFDAVLAMYHDQGLIPFKALVGEQGVNFTAGLPIIRTSPDHGVGYDIAGENKANEQSLRSAIYMAIDVYRNRCVFDEISANPLPFYVKEIGGKDESMSDVEARNSRRNERSQE